MKQLFLSTVLVAASAFTTQAAATTTINLQNFNGTLIDNQWFDFGGSMLHTSPAYSTPTSDGLGSLVLSPVIDGAGDASHIHVSGGCGAGCDATPFIHGDVGGVYIDGTGSHETFSLQSMNVIHAVLNSAELSNPNTTVTVRGFLGGTNGMENPAATGNVFEYVGGAQVAETTISNGFSGIVDFLAADAGFGAVDYVEFFFTDFYTLKPSSFGDTTLEFEWDNIVIGTEISAVPVPAAVWLFGTGIVGLLSIGRRKQTSFAA